MTAVKRRKHRVRDPFLITKDDVDLAPLQFSQQVRRQRDSRGLQQQDRDLAEMDPGRCFAGPDDEVIHLIIQLAHT